MNRTRALLGAAAALALGGCGPFPYDARTGLRITFESDLAPGAADTLRVWFATPAGAVLGEMQDLALAPPDFEEFPFSVNAHAGDVTVPSALTVLAEARLGDAVVGSGTVETTLVAGRLADVTLLLVPAEPPAPALSAAAALTNEASVAVEGTAARGSTVRVSGGLSTVEVSAVDPATGAWSADVPLRPNVLNVLTAVAVGTGGQAGPPSAPVEVTHDDLPPAAPILGPLPSQTGAASVIVTGSAEPLAGILVGVLSSDLPPRSASANGSAAADGTFAVAVALLTDTLNALSVTVMDAAGNVSDPATAAVEHGTGFETPPSVDPLPPYVNSPTVTITGTATASAMVEATNDTAGGASVIDVADPTSGAFSITIALAANTANSLDVHVVGSMVGVDVAVTHDDIPPDPPVVNALASPTGAIEVSVSGLAEAGAAVTLVRTAPATGDYTAAATGGPAGDFLFTMVPLALDATNTIDIGQTDRAGNVSVATTTVTVDQTSALPPPPEVTSPMDGAATNLPSAVLTGTVANPGPGVEIVVERGGVEVAANTTNATTGDFTVTVPLAANVTNDLELFSRLGAAESGRLLFTITHDDLPPAAPNAALVSATGSCPLLAPGTVNVSGAAGSVEPLAQVTVQSMAESLLVMAAADGAFATGPGGLTVDHPLSGCEPSITIRATDRAGNTSAPTTKTVSY